MSGIQIILWPYIVLFWNAVQISSANGFAINVLAECIIFSLLLKLSNSRHKTYFFFSFSADHLFVDQGEQPLQTHRRFKVFRFRQKESGRLCQEVHGKIRRSLQKIAPLTLMRDSFWPNTKTFIFQKNKNWKTCKQMLRANNNKVAS